MAASEALARVAWAAAFWELALAVAASRAALAASALVLRPSALALLAAYLAIIFTFCSLDGVFVGFT